MPFFTVFIPTYNRADLLPRALASIERQTFRDFDVLIVDDGSTDRTGEIVAEWRARMDFPVQYVRQENAGKIAAYNRAIAHVDGFLMVLLDSDDELTPQALEIYHRQWHAIPESQRERYAGVEGLSILMPSGEIAGERFPQDGMTSTYPEMRFEYGISGDKRHALRTSVMREFPFPLFAGEKHNRESLIWCRMAGRYVFRYFNEVVQQIHYQQDGLSAQTTERRRQSPRGFSLAFLEMINEQAWHCSPKQVRRDAANYVRYALHAGVGLREQHRAVRDKRLWWRVLPGGVMHWLADRLRGSRQPVNNPHRIACFLSTSGHSGVDRAMQHLIPSLAARGYQVDLLHIERHGPYLPEIPERVKVVELGTRSTYPSLVPLIRYLRRSRPAVLLADKDRVNRTALLARFLSRTRPRLVLSSGTTISIDLAHRGAFERWLQRFSMGRLYPYADSVIVTSQGVAEDMAAYTGLPREHIRVVPSPVIPDDAFERRYPRPEHPWFQPGEPPVILGVGELGMRKDFPTLIRAFARLHERRPCRLVILGKGKQKATLEALARSLGLAEAVDLVGFKPNPYDYMAHAALFAFTSQWEGLGFVLIEALALGTPAVSVDCPSGPSEILQGGKYGRLVPIGDDAALSEAMLATLDAPLPREVLQQAARPYSVSASTDAYLRAFELPLSVLSGAGDEMSGGPA